LLAAARALHDRGEHGPAVVVAQSAAEIAVAAAVRGQLRRSGVPEALAAWIVRRDVRGQSFSPDSERIQALWAALTGDRLPEAGWWAGYRSGVHERDRFVHEGQAVSATVAADFLAAVGQLVERVRTASAAA
jgi:hypothetical protein